MTVPPQLLELLVCPRCKGELAYDEPQQRLTCPACRIAYPVREGIPIMLVDEATPL